MAVDLVEGRQFMKEGRWECYSQYKEQNCLSYFLSMQCTDRGHLAVVALSYSQKVMAARRPLLVKQKQCIDQIPLLK